MRYLVTLLALFCFGCGPGDTTTEVNVSTGEESSAGDPITDNRSDCASSEDQCAQQVQ